MVLLTCDMTNCSRCGKSIQEGQRSSCSICYMVMRRKWICEQQENVRHEESIKQQIMRAILAETRYKKLTWDNGL
jgi:hypothetical protein